MKKSNARATLESMVLRGLAKRAHLTGASVEHADIQVPDIIEAMFDLPVRWAVMQYVGELELEEAEGERDGE